MDSHRKLCNIVKKKLLILAVKETKKVNKSVFLLDLCCGRGGDIFKWGNLEIQRVLALDNHQESVDEAINRYKKVSRRIKTRISFVQRDVGAGYSDLLNYKASIISCQFALHYFNDLVSFLSEVSNSLIQGGYFIGICPDGDLIDSLLDNNIKTENVELDRAGPSSYYFKLVDTDTNNRTDDYFKYKGLSREYIIRKEELASIANSVGLELIEYGNLKDKWKGNHISGLYFSFIFVKK
jgi:SAM-dependent methyltransferase